MMDDKQVKNARGRESLREERHLMCWNSEVNRHIKMEIMLYLGIPRKIQSFILIWNRYLPSDKSSTDGRAVTVEILKDRKLIKWHPADIEFNLTRFIKVTEKADE